jgi:hypothetical protein
MYKHKTFTRAWCEDVKFMAWGRCCTSCKINLLILPNKVGFNSMFRCKTVRSGRCGVYGQ